MIPLLKDAFSRSDRLQGLDVARALALLGMFVTHTMSLSTSTGVPEPAAMVAGKAAALFAVLAGFSITLSTRKYDSLRDGALSLVTRGVLIAFIGLVLGSFTTHIAVILVNYGVMFLLAAPIFRAPTRVLAILAPAWLVVMPVAGFALRAAFDIPRQVDVPSLANYTDVHYMATGIFFSGYYPVLQWFGYLLVGLLLSRLDWSAKATELKVAAVGATAASVAFLSSMTLLAVGGTAAITKSAEGVGPAAWGSVEAALQTGSYGTVPTDTWWWLVVSGPHTSTPFDMVYTAGLAVLTIALCSLLCRTLADRGWYLFPLLAAGSMPLTLYSAHVLLREANDSFLIHAVLLLTVAVLWRLHSKRPGLLEWGVTSAVWRVTSFRGIAEGPGMNPRHGETETAHNNLKE